MWGLDVIPGFNHRLFWLFDSIIYRLGLSELTNDLGVWYKVLSACNVDVKLIAIFYFLWQILRRFEDQAVFI